MEIFLVRHATAVDETFDISDAHRSLSDHGRMQAKQLGDRLRWHDCEPTHIFTSPLVRAVQTAELVAAGVNAGCAIDVLPALAPGVSPRAVVKAVRALPDDAIIMLFGHAPDLSTIAALLVGDPSFSGIDKAEAVRITNDTLRWRFRWDGDAPVGRK